MSLQEKQASIMGSSFYPGANNCIPRLKPGQQLRVDREPTNPHDRNAISLHIFNQKLGHLPRGLAAELAPLMDAGVTVNVTKSRDPRFGTSGVVVVRWEIPDEPPVVAGED